MTQGHCDTALSYTESNLELRGGHENAHLPELALTLGRTVQQNPSDGNVWYLHYLIQQPRAKSAYRAFEL